MSRIVHEFVCDFCGATTLVTDIEWRSFKFSGFPPHCGKPMRRIDDPPTPSSPKPDRVSEG